MSKDWKSAIVRPEASIRDAIAIIDKSTLKIALVVGDDDQLLGVVTDGDIRRGILRQVEMDQSVLEVANPNPLTCGPEQSFEQIRELLAEKLLLHMPIVQAGRIVDLVTWDQTQISRRYENPVFLMAGGFGKRLLPLTEETPKPLLKVGDKPILESIIERFVAAGFCNFYISVHYLSEQLVQHFGDGERWGASIQYVKEDHPLGTAGALGLLPHAKLPDCPIIVMNGDLLTQVDLQELLKFHHENQALATMCVRQYEFKVPYGVVRAQGTAVHSIIEKPTQKFFVNAGIYVLGKALVQTVSAEIPIDMPDLLMQQVENQEKVAMFPIHEYWLDIGQPEDFDQAQIDFQNISHD
ncbi:MAG: nucleotidyltransferase family protein [Pseudomonadales bacterium]